MRRLGILALCMGLTPRASAEQTRFTARDVFELELAEDPRISPDGRRVVYVRTSMDILKDAPRTALWIADSDGSGHRPLTAPGVQASSPRWSPDATRLLYVARTDHGGQIFLRYMDTGQEACLTHVSEAPEGIVWSSDGRFLAFSMFVPETVKSPMELPAKPEGADWGPPLRYIDTLQYRFDGEGYLKSGFEQVFVLPVEGGTPRQITRGRYHHRGAIVWSPDGKSLLLSANRHEDADYRPLDSEIYEVQVGDGAGRALTDRRGPDGTPTISPDGRLVAYTGFDDRYQGYQVTRLYVMNRDGSGSRLLSGDLDRDVESPAWSRDGRGLFFLYEDRGNSKIGYLPLTGGVKTLAGDVGHSLDRPYSGGSFTVAGDGRFANLIHHAYPGHDYEDLMSGVDAVIARGYVDPARLYVTGGSGGGVLTSWIVGSPTGSTPIRATSWPRWRTSSPGSTDTGRSPSRSPEQSAWPAPC